MPRIAIVFFDPCVETLAEGVVMKMIAESTFGPVNDITEVRCAFETDFFRTEKPDNPGWIEAAVFDPFALEDGFEARAVRDLRA